MLMFSLPRDIAPEFVNGKPVTVRINGVPRQLTFDKEARTVNYGDEEGPQCRKFLVVEEVGDLIRFTCAGADGSGIVLALDKAGRPISFGEPPAGEEGGQVMETEPDLRTHEGRLTFIRRYRAQNETGRFLEALRKALAVDPYPVLRVFPGEGIGFYTRRQFMEMIGKRENSPNLWRFLEKDEHPPGTVIWFLSHGHQHSFLYEVMIPKGLPEHN
jgi:hypothetical protein